MGIVIIDASERRSKHKAEQIIQDICERLYEDNEDLSADENKKWIALCQEWIEKNHKKDDEVVQSEDIMNGKKIRFSDFFLCIKNVNRIFQ